MHIKIPKRNALNWRIILINLLAILLILAASSRLLIAATKIAFNVEFWYGVQASLGPVLWLLYIEQAPYRPKIASPEVFALGGGLGAMAQIIVVAFILSGLIKTYSAAISWARKCG